MLARGGSRRAYLGVHRLLHVLDRRCRRGVLCAQLCDQHSTGKQSACRTPKGTDKDAREIAAGEDDDGRRDEERRAGRAALEVDRLGSVSAALLLASNAVVGSRLGKEVRTREKVSVTRARVRSAPVRTGIDGRRRLTETGRAERRAVRANMLVCFSIGGESVSGWR